jgi:uncharacterized OsmC-like protein
MDTKEVPAALDRIKTAIERSKKAISLKPSLGLGTGVSKSRIVSGLHCEITEGNWKLSADMPEGVGGSTKGPTPGVYGRAALGSCLAIGYMMKAASMGIPIHALEVEIQADYDDGALLGTSSEVPGYIEVRYTINIETDAPKTDVIRLIDDADRHSPYLDVFSRGQKCIRNINITSVSSTTTE